MSLYLHTIKPASGSKKKRKTIGRGGKRGTYSGRGLKGQRSRSGGKSHTLRRGLRQLVERTHKLPGFKSIYPKPAVVSLRDLSRHFEDGDTVNPASLVQKNLIQNSAQGVKILANGHINVKINVENCLSSAGAKQAIEAVGGTVKGVEVEKEKKEASKE